MSNVHTSEVVKLSRRHLLGLGVGAFLTAPMLVQAQSMLENSPSSGQGWSPAPANPPAPANNNPMQGSYAPVADQSSKTQDWRQYLLSGERSILLRRDGPVQRIRYCTDAGLLDASGYSAACMLLRDTQAGKLYPMDIKLLDILCGIQRWMEYNGRSAIINITSGFRTERTNRSTEGAAMNSMHLYGKAADIVITGASSGLVGAMAKQFNTAGGNGIYLGRGFVHVDTGYARTWVSSQVKRQR